VRRRPEEVVEVQFRFEDYALDIERRELRRGAQQRPEDRARYADGLRTAGLPE
jgi:hypothetical protein